MCQSSLASVNSSGWTSKPSVICKLWEREKAAYRGILAIPDYMYAKNQKSTSICVLFTGHSTASTCRGEESYFIRKTHLPSSSVQASIGPEGSIAMMC